jgi:hypothetical protein
VQAILYFLKREASLNAPVRVRWPMIHRREVGKIERVLDFAIAGLHYQAPGAPVSTITSQP